MRKRRHVGFVGAGFLAVFAAAGSARSAEVTAVSVTVRDGAGAPVPGATVVVLDWLQSEC